MNQKLIVTLLSGFVGGVLLGSFLNFGWAFALFFIFLGIFLGIINFLSENRGLFLLIGIALISLGLGMARYELENPQENTELLEERVGKKVSLEGIIVDEPEERENYTKLVLESNENRVLIYTYHHPEFHYGDKIKVAGMLKRPENINDSFDWISFLAKDDIYFEMIYPQVNFISSGNGSIIKEKLFLLKENFLNALGRVIPEPNSAFMGGLTVGAKRSMPKELLDDFRTTGVIHIVVLSGYNITLVADSVMKIFSFLPGFLGMGVGILAIILFTIMTGAGAATVRASIMALLIVLARATGRIYQITWALFLTGFFMVFHNPKILRFDTGFQLSFLATLSLIYLAPYFEKKFYFLPQKFNLRGIASATVSTQIFVLPLLLYKMGLFSAVSLPVNLLILTFVPVTMFFGFLTSGIGMISSALSIPFGWISYALTQYELWIVKIFASLPFASKTISNFPLWPMLIIYAFYAIIIYAKIYKKS